MGRRGLGRVSNKFDIKRERREEKGRGEQTGRNVQIGKLRIIYVKRQKKLDC